MLADFSKRGNNFHFPKGWDYAKWWIFACLIVSLHFIKRQAAHSLRLLQIRKYSRSTRRWAKQIFRHKLRAEPSTKTFYDCLSSKLLQQFQVVSWRRLKSFCFTNDLLFILSQFMRKLWTKMINYHFRVKVRPPTLLHEIFDTIHIWMNEYNLIHHAEVFALNEGTQQIVSLFRNRSLWEVFSHFARRWRLWNQYLCDGNLIKCRFAIHETRNYEEGRWSMKWMEKLSCSRRITRNIIKAALHLNKQKYTKYPKPLLKLKEDENYFLINFI